GNEIKKAEAKGGDVRRQVSDQLVGQARKARERFEPVYKKRVEPVVKERVEPVYKKRVEPIVKERVEPVYTKRFEPTGHKVREAICVLARAALRGGDPVGLLAHIPREQSSPSPPSKTGPGGPGFHVCVHFEPCPPRSR